MPATAVFYHLTHAGLAETVGMILPRAVAQGWRVMLRCPAPDLAKRLDDALWLPDESFLPHGLATGGADDAGQPVLIGPGAAVNAAQGLMLVAGAVADVQDLPGLERIWVLFDGSDPEAVSSARTQWTQLTGLGLAAQYWSDESGSWVKKTERPAAGS